MPFNVPEDQKPEFNKKVKGSLELLTAGVTDKLRKIELESADTLVEAYNQPVSEAELTQVPPSDMVTVDPQMARRIEIDSLRMPDGTIYRNANELFSKPVDFNQFQAIGFVDKEGNATPNGELFFNLKEAGMFNEDGTLTKKGQAYSMSERDLEDEANLDAFETLWKDGVIRPSATWDEQLEAAAGFVGNAFVGFTDLMQTFGKSISVKNAFDVLTGTPEGKKLEAEFQTSGLAAIEKITTNFANLGRLADVGAAALADTIQQEDVAMIGPGGVPMYTQSVEALQQQNAEAERDLYAARQRQWKQNRDIQSFEVGQIAETVLGLDGAVKMAEDARNTLGAEEFNKRYSRVGAFSELAFDPTNLIPASVAFNVAKSVPIASRLTLGAQKMLGRVAQTEAELAKVQAVVQAGNAVLKKEELFVPRYQQLFKNMSAKAADNPELMVRANEVLDRAKQITASADEVRAAMPTAMNTLEELTVKRNSLATRIPEAYANKVMQTVELGRRIRSAPARTLSSMLERTGNTLTKVDDAVTTYLKDRGLDQAYNAALGASGVVGLAGNPVVGAIGVTGAALKSGKFLTEYGKILRYVGKEMENARGQIPFWKRVAAHTAPGSLGRGIAHTFNIFELGGATSDIIRRAGRGVAAAYPTDLFFEWLSDGADMRPQTMTQAAAESLVIGGSFAAAGGAFMGTNKRMRELSIGDEINFRQGLTDTKQKALYESLPPGVRRSMATYSIANPTLNYNFIDSGTSGYDINTNTANINVNSSNPLKALVAHETLHHTLIKNNMEGGIAALFLGDTKANAVGGLFRSKDGKLDPDFEKFKDGYYKRLRDAGMTDAEIGIEYPLDKIAVEYFIEQHADQYATMAETGELGALAARGEVRKKLGAVLETVLPKIPVLRDLHIKSGGAIDANGAWVKGNGILGDDKIRQNPIANRMFREMNRRSSGMMPGQFEPLISDKEGSGAPLMFDPANAIDMELMHPFIQMDENDKPILKDGRPVFIDKSVDIDRAMAGLTAMEAMRKRRESNYAPEKGEAYIDDDGELQPGWLSDAVLNEIFAKHKFNNEQKRMIRQTNKLIKQGQGQRMVMINFPATTRLKSGKVVYAPQKAAIRDAVPVAMTISKDGNILYGLMSVTKLQENIKKRAQSKRGKKLYAGNVDAILQDVQAMMDFHLNRPTEDSIVHFNEKYGVVEGTERKRFINTMFGLLNKKEQAVLNPMLLEDGVKSADNVYRTYRADRVSKAIPMAPEEYAAMPFSYEAVSQVRMPEAQRAMPEGISPEDLNPVANKQEAQGLWADGKQMFAINEMDEKLIPITSKAMLDSYPADAIGWMEPDTELTGQMRFMPESEKATPAEVLQELDSTNFIPRKMAAKILGPFPEYLTPVADFIAKQREKLVSGTITPRDVWKAYAMTVASQGTGAVSVDLLRDKLAKVGIDFNPTDLFTDTGKSGQRTIRPEEAAAYWLGTPEGKRALDNAESGNTSPSDWDGLVQIRKAYGDDRFKTFNVFSDKNLSKIPVVVDQLNQSKGNSKKVLDAVQLLNGVSTGKKGFISHLLGLGNTPTIDAVEINFWLTGKGDVGTLKTKEADLARKIKDTFSDKRVREEMFNRVDNSINLLRDVAEGGKKVPKEVWSHVMHHWLWDKAKGLETTHAGMYEAQMRFMPEKIDADYMKAVESGDVEAQQRIVDEMARKAGYSIGPVFHGTDSNFNEFKKTGDVGFHFGTKEQASYRYGKNSRIIPAYLKSAKSVQMPDHSWDDPNIFLNKVNDVAKVSTKSKELVENWDRLGVERKKTDWLELPMDEGTKLSYARDRSWRDAAKEAFASLKDDLLASGIDAIRYDNKVEGKGESIIVLTPSQIKSADPITRDDSGNIIPPSKRFDITSKDLRFMPEGERKIIDQNIPEKEGGNMSPSTWDSLKKVGYNPEASEKTQIATTAPTYESIVKANATQGMEVLDFSAGRGIGTKAMKAIGKKVGFNVEGYEPFSNKQTRVIAPEYEGEESINQIPDNSKDIIINNAVLNVVPEATGRQIVNQIYSKLKPGGSAFINVMGWNNIKNRLDNPKTKLVGPREVITQKGTFQKGYTAQSLRSLIEQELPDAKIVRTSHGDIGFKVTKPAPPAETMPAINPPAKTGQMRFLPEPVEKLSAFKGKRVQVLTSDLSLVGDIKYGDYTARFQGGPGYLDNDGWGFTDKDAADGFVTRWKRDGKPLIGLASLGSGNHLNSLESRKAYAEKWKYLIQSGKLNKADVDAHIKDAMSRIINSEAKKVKTDWVNAAKMIESADDLANYFDKIPWAAAPMFYEKLTAKTLPIKYSTLVENGLDLESVAREYRQPEYENADIGDLYAIAEYDGSEPEYSPDLNRAYPWRIKFKKKATLSEMHNVADLTTDPRAFTGKKVGAKLAPQPLMVTGIQLDKLMSGDIKPSGKPVSLKKDTPKTKSNKATEFSTGNPKAYKSYEQVMAERELEKLKPKKKSKSKGNSSAIANAANLK